MNKYYIVILVFSILGGILSFIAKYPNIFYVWVAISILISITDFFNDCNKNQKKTNDYLENINKNITNIITKLESNE